MEVIYERCAGLDVHKKTVVGCRVHRKGRGRKVQETRSFGTTAAELLELLDWLERVGVHPRGHGEHGGDRLTLGT